MEKFWEICKSHPLYVGGGVLFLVIVFYLMSRGGSSSSGGTQAGIYDITQDPNVIAANAAQATSQNNANAAVAIATLQADTQGKAISAGQASQDLATTTQATTMASYFAAETAALQAQYGAAVTINGQNDYTASNIAQIQETGQVTMNNTASQTAEALQSNNNQTAISLTGMGYQNQQLLANLGMASQQFQDIYQLTKDTNDTADAIAIKSDPNADNYSAAANGAANAMKDVFTKLIGGSTNNLETANVGGQASADYYAQLQRQQLAAPQIPSWIFGG